MTTAYSPSIITNGLVLTLDAGNIKSYPGSGTTWSDLSGNNNTGVLTNGPTFDSANGGSIVFDGTNDVVVMPSIELRRDFSLDIWVRFNVFSGNGGGLFGQGTTSTNNGLHIFQNTNNTINFRMYFSDFNPTVTSTIDTWYNYVFTYLHTSPFTKTVYRNGQLVGASTSGQSQYAGTGAFRVGGTFSSGNGDLNGRVGLTRVYSKILSAEEVSQNFNANRKRFNV